MLLRKKLAFSKQECYIIINYRYFTVCKDMEVHIFIQRSDDNGC